MVEFGISQPVAPQEVCDLREAVGWDRRDALQATARYWATVSGRDTATGALVAWLEIVSDGAEHAILLDVIVHPAYQRQGVGLALVQAALAHIRAHGITIVHVDFLPEAQGFYERCGFRTGLGGILEG